MEDKGAVKHGYAPNSNVSVSDSCRHIVVIGNEKRPTARQVVKKLMAEDGWAGLYRGLGPRFFSMSAWGTTMILAYEYLKRLCVKDE